MLCVRKRLSLASTTLAGQNGFARHDHLYYHVCELKKCTIRGPHEVPYMLSSMLLLCATVVLSLSYHRYCHVYCHLYVSSARRHREPSSLSSLEYYTAQNAHAPDAPRRDVVRKTQSLVILGSFVFSGG